MPRIRLAALVCAVVLIGGFLAWVGWTIGGYAIAGVLLAVVVGAIVVLALVRRGLPELGWLTGLITFGIVLVVLFQVVMPWLYASVDRSVPYASRSAGRDKVIRDLRASEAIDPVAGGAEAATREYCRERERIDEGVLQKKQIDLLRERRDGRVIEKAKEDEMFGRIPAIAEDRLDCQRKAGKGIPERPGLKPMTSYLPTRDQGWFFLIGSLLLVLAVIASITRPRIRVTIPSAAVAAPAAPPAGSPVAMLRPSRLRRAALAALVMLLVLTVAYWFLWGGGRAVFTRGIGSVPGAVFASIPAPTGQPTTLELEAGQEVALGKLIPACWDYRFSGPAVAAGATLRFADGGTEVIAGRNFGTRTVEAIQGSGTAYLWLMSKPCG